MLGPMTRQGNSRSTGGRPLHEEGLRRRVRTGKHGRRLDVYVDERLYALVEETAAEFGYAKGVIARDAIEQGIWRTREALGGKIEQYE